MGERVLLAVNEDGGITLPPAARRALEVEQGSQVECEVVDGTVVLRRVDTATTDDAWLYRPETVQRIKQAAQRAGNGRRWRVSEAFLLGLAAKAEAAHGTGQELSPEALREALDEAERSGEVEQVGPDLKEAAGR